MATTSKVMTPLWALCYACTLALGWLLPNHYPPWLSFHVDAWISVVLMVTSAAVIVRIREPLVWPRIAALIALLVFVPWVQYAFAMVPSAGGVWVTSAYLLGLLLALLVGVRWESSSPGQLGDGLFLAIGIASVMSVGLQLQQWLEPDSFGIWMMGGGSDRPHANLGQPNQLATLLLWGLLATAWGLMRQYIGIWSAVFISIFLLFGVALTGSRTAWFGVVLVVGAAWVWRRLWPDPRWHWIATSLGLYFVACVMVQGWIRHLAPGHSDTVVIGEVIRMSGELRPLAWAAFLDAAGQRPWLGYGWGQIAAAQMAVATEHPNLGHVFSYSHNLLLDLVLWCGIPLGILIFGWLVRWFLTSLRAVQTAEDAVLMLFLLVIGNHAMLELPLYSGYFLFPVGLVMGAINVRLGARPVLQTGRWLGLGLWVITATLLALIIRDYSRVESSYQTLRMEWMNFKITMPVNPPDVLLLTQWRDYIQYARIKPAAGMSSDELDLLQTVVVLYPNLLLFHKLATSMALNQRPQEAILWLQRLCKVVPESQCLDVKSVWAKQALQYPEIAAIPWPVKSRD